jgi:hypothetical protein
MGITVLGGKNEFIKARMSAKVGTEIFKVKRARAG